VPTPDEQEIFHAARRIEAPEARRAYLDRACADEPGLRARVEALLRVHDEEPGFLRLPAEGARSCAALLAREGPGTMIGSYKLLEEIGEGGFGVVFLAEQQQPVRRKVALKILKPGMDTRQVVARFEAERQALALMDHPNIAKVHEGGETPSGRPYFVMEPVRGVPITDFCDESLLPVRRRLELFVSLCRAVHHAHQKGVIHRDIKPSNVLVTLHDGAPVVKVIDFGVAKALGERLTDKTLITGVAQMVGTPLYMSPEQAEMSGHDVDTRADIYALGVLLYELLTGRTPFDKERLRAAPFDELRRIIREEEPARPSNRISTLADGAVTVSVKRGSDPKRLSGLLRGELDWIVMKCLEKDRNRRYETADGLARDVQRYLNDEPVEACPPSAGYRLRKFARRHKGPVVAASLVAIALLGGIIGTTVGLVQAGHARDTAEKRLAQVEKGIDILGSIFEGVDPEAEETEGRPLRAILGDRLDQAATELEGEALGDPLVVSRLQDRLGRTYLSLGHHEKAAALFRKAVATDRVELGPEHPVTLRGMHNLAQASKVAGKFTEAIALYEELRDIQVRTIGADDPDTLDTLQSLGETYWRAGMVPEGVALLEKVRDAVVKRNPADDPRTLSVMMNLAGAYMAAGKHAESAALLEKVLDARVKQYGDTHVGTLRALNNLAYTYRAGSQMRRAVLLFEKARDGAVPKLGPYHPLTLDTLDNLGRTYRAYGKTAEAIALHEQVLPRRVLLFGTRHPGTLTTMYYLGMDYQDAKQPEKALPLLQQAAAGIELYGFELHEAGDMIEQLCICHEQLKQYEQAEVWRRKWVPLAMAKGGPQSRRYAEALAGLGSNLVRQQKHADAEPFLRESLALLEKLKPEDWETFRTQSLCGAALLGQRKYADAEPHLVRGCHGMAGWADRLGPSHGSFTRKPLTEALERLVQLYDAWGKPDEAVRWRKELEGMKSAQPR
jgi:serine/threonine protein kinase/tetratricopeptide (TPR) repeat protein